MREKCVSCFMLFSHGARKENRFLFVEILLHIWYLTIFISYVCFWIRKNAFRIWNRLFLFFVVVVIAKKFCVFLCVQEIRFVMNSHLQFIYDIVNSNHLLSKSHFIYYLLYPNWQLSKWDAWGSQYTYEHLGCLTAFARKHTHSVFGIFINSLRNRLRAHTQWYGIFHRFQEFHYRKSLVQLLLYTKVSVNCNQLSQ